MPGKPSAVSVVIPCFNEKEAIEGTIEEIERLDFPAEGFELLVVDDGSDDGSGRILDRLAESRDHVSVLRHDTNRGYGASLKTGIRRARGEIIVITDADGTYPNSRIPDIVGEIHDADMVVGSRTGPSVEYSRLRKFPKSFLIWYSSWITKRRIPDINSGLRAFRKPIVEKYLHILPDTFSFATTITIAFLTNDYAVKFIPIDYSRRIGKSKIKPVRDTLRFVQLILRTGMYFAPLRACMPIVVALAAAFMGSVAYDVYYGPNLTDKTLGSVDI